MKSTRQAVLILAILCLCCYAMVFFNELMLDDSTFLDPATQRQYSSLKDYFTVTDVQHYIPLYYFVNVNLFKSYGTSPFILHGFNLFFFFVSVILFYRLCHLITDNLKLSFYAAVLSIVHPVQAFTVQYITANFVFFTAIFMFLAMITYLRQFQYKEHVLALKIFSLIFFILSLLCFEGAFLFPVYLAAVLYFVKHLRFKEIILRTMPFFAIAALYFVFWTRVAGGRADLAGKIADLHLNGIEWIGGFSVLVIWYVRSLLFPSDLVFIKNIHPADAGWWPVGLFIFLLVASLVLLWRWKKNYKSFCLIWFWSGFVLVCAAMFAHAYMGLVIEPHWLYFSSFAFFLLAASCFQWLTQKIPSPLIGRTIFYGVTVALFIVTQSYNLLARNEFIYASYWYRQTPDNYIPLMSLGKHYSDQKKYKMAGFYFEEAIRSSRYPSFDANYNLGAIHSQRGHFNKAKKYFNRARQIDPNKAVTYNALGTIAVRQQDIQKAEDYFKQAINLDPYLITPRLNLSDLWILQNSGGRAAHLLEETVQKNPQAQQNPSILFKIIDLNLQQKNISRALPYIEMLLIQDEDIDHRIRLVKMLENSGYQRMALDMVSETLAVIPDHKELMLYQGVLSANQGQLERARKVWERGRALYPDDQRFIENLKKLERLK